MTPEWLLVLWLVAGLAFWLDVIRRTGMPRRWKRSRRDVGWAETLGIDLPTCLVGGPLWWCALLYRRLSER